MNGIFIFDMDGVLIDSEPMHIEMESEVYKELGIEISEEEMHGFVGRSPLEVWSEIREEHGLTQSARELKEYDFDRKLEWLKARELEPIPGIPELIRDLEKREITLAVASSSPPDMIELVTRKLHIQHRFELMASGEEVPNGKPAPDLFLKVAKYFSVEPESCVVIEDSSNGVKAAKAAGMYCIGFRNPNSGNQNLSAADMIVDDFGEESRERILQYIAVTGSAAE